MKVNIYYGGRGLIDDPTLQVLGIIQEVLEELNVKVSRYNLYELKNSISSLPQTMKEADGIILASTVEWHGIGGYMQTFLDALWLYGDREKIASTYMCPIVMSTAYGEKEGRLFLESAWEILGGKLCDGISGYIKDATILETEESYKNLIEKKAENIYRTINQSAINFPASSNMVMKVVAVRPNSDLTPQETEQLSQYVSDDSYMQKSKEDIQELVNYFKEKLDAEEDTKEGELIQAFTSHFKPQPGCKVAYQLHIDGKNNPLVIKVDVSELECYYGTLDNADVDIHLSQNVLDEIIYRNFTFQRAFMAGNMKMRGDFKQLCMLDIIFKFGDE